jgi:anti-sigma factor RsiW
MGVRMTGQDTTLELINAEIDGVLTGPQRAELNRLLLADPSVRALRDGLMRTCRAIDEMPREEIPAGLHEAIVTGLPAAAAPKSHGFPHTSFTSRPLLRYAAAFGGGLLVSALAFQLGRLDSTEFGAGQLSGTIAAATHAEARMIVNLDQVRGSITLTGAADAPQVVTSLESTRPVSIVTHLHEDGRVEVQVVDDATATVLQRGKLRIGPGQGSAD